MNDERTYDLLRDLAKLLKKYGPEAFETLAALLSTPEFLEKLSILLKSTATIKRARGDLGKASVAIEILRLKESDPKKYGLITSVKENLEMGKYLPSLKDIESFAAENGLPDIETSSRSKAIRPLLQALLQLPPEKVEKIISRMAEMSESRSKLSDWGEIITQGMSRSQKSAASD